ncbi:MAG: serine/threonine-protein kinase, partial [Myxococcota bacterium]
MADAEVRYRFLSVLGEGGFGKVYRARMEAAEGFHKDVAIKVLHDPNPPRSLLQRHRDEAKILGLIRDRAIVGVEPPIRVGNQWAVVMEFVDGVSCGALISAGPVPPGVAVEIVGEVARALHNVYQMEGPEGQPLHLLHRDIKPDNVQVTPAGEIRLLDFGIARANFAAREFKTRHSIGGTPGYIAPERLHAIETPAGDVFSLGVLLHEIVTGDRPKYAPTVHLDGNGLPVVDTAEIAEGPIPPDRAEVLKLSAWMRADEPEERPSARDVERECRRLRNQLDGAYLRDWAEEHVPHRNDLAPDEMIGRVITATSGQLTLTPIDGAERLAPPTVPPVNAG